MLGMPLPGWKQSIRFGLPLIVFMASIVWLSPLAVSHEDDKPNPKLAPDAVRVNPVDLEIVLGFKDDQQIPWKGQVEVSAGRVVNVELVRASSNSTVEENKFNVRVPREGGGIGAQGQRPAQQRKAQRAARAQAAAGQKPADAPTAPADQPNAAPADKPPADKPGAAAAPQKLKFDPAHLKVQLDAPPDAKVRVITSRGDFSTALAELPLGDAKFFLDGQTSIERLEVITPLTGRETEDDFPVITRGRGGVYWLAYVIYTPGPPLVAERVLGGQFDALIPKHNGDQIFLRSFDGKTWTAPMDVTGTGCDVWRPTITVDGKGTVWVVWTQKVDDDWELLSRRYQPPADPAEKGTWSDIEQLTHAPGTDLGVVATTDSQGRVWIAWQAWRDGNYDILAASAGNDGRWSEPQTISNSKANDWSPAIAADQQGNVYIAWDTYDAGNYDVQLRVLGSQPRTLSVAKSARFEGRPHLTCDGDNRLWIAYEEGNEQWGKDYLSTKDFGKVGFSKNPGFALYIDRTVRVKCLVDGVLKQPAGSLEAALSETLKFNRSLPRLAADRSGGLWLFVRHRPVRKADPGQQRPQAPQNGEVWNSFALRYDGSNWSKPRTLLGSSNLMDNRPALAPLGDDLLVVYSGDGRHRTQDRDQDDLYTAVLKPTGKTQAPEFVDDTPPPAAEVTVVHPNEAEDVARMRAFRLKTDDRQELRLIRGEFHRHTEFSAHNDADGLLEDSLRYALDAGRLDWMGNGDHDNGFGHEYMWWLIQKTFDLHTHPPYFVGAMTYERSVVFPNGHRNVIMPRRGIRPLPRGELPGTEEEGTPDTKMLYAYLKHFGGMCASHTSGTNMGTDWRDNDPDVEPVVEIYQGHRHNYEHFGAPRSATAETQIGGYQPSGFIWNALARGYRLGFESSSDHVSTHISYGVLFVKDVSRQAIIDAFKQRHCYAATDNIVLVVRSGGHLMGDSFETTERPTLSIEAEGTAPIAKFHVVRDNKYIYTAEPNEQHLQRTFTDNEAEPGKTSYYYVRIEQADGNLAWASPMWITYKKAD